MRGWPCSMAHRSGLYPGVLCFVRHHEQLWVFPELLYECFSQWHSRVDNCLHWHNADGSYEFACSCIRCFMWLVWCQGQHPVSTYLVYLTKGQYLYLGSGIGTVIALLMLSFTQSGQFWQVFLAQGLLMGLTIAFGVQPAQTIVGQHFKERRALAMGLVTTGSALGGIGFPLMFEKLVPRIGLANTLRLTALKVGFVRCSIRYQHAYNDRICYSIALCISSSRQSKDSDRKSWRSLVDFKGFLDIRYAVLCVGTWFAILGLWIPSYYMSEFWSYTSHLPTDRFIETYADLVYPGNNISEYFLCIINGSNILGAVL